MKRKTTVWRAFIIVLILALVTLTCSAGHEPATDNGTKVVTDMAGREVTIPKNIGSIATVGGGLPPVNSYIFAIGQGKKIANDLPDIFAKAGRHEYQYVIEPGLKSKPRIQTTALDFSLEDLMKINPDIAFTMNKNSMEIIEKSGIPVIYLSSSKSEKDVMKLLGEIFGEEERAKKYARYFDDTIARVDKVISSIPDDKRLKVLFWNYKGMSECTICKGRIEKSGGIPVSTNDSSNEGQFDYEQLLTWDPDVMVLLNPEEIDQVYNDKRLSGVSAVKNKKVYLTPTGAHYWWGTTCETPLMVLWTAKTIYPEQFKDLDMEEEVIHFYKEFFDCDLTRKQAAGILSGKAMNTTA